MATQSPDWLRNILDGMPKARYQEPTIKQNKNGSYYIRPWLDVLTDKGLWRKKRTIILGPLSIGKRGAITKKNELMGTINRADYVIQAQIPFSQMLDEYLTSHVRAVDKLAASTRAKYECHIKNHVGPAFKDLQLCEITTKRIDEWIQAKAKSGLSWATRCDLRNILSGIFTQAKAMGFYPKNEVNPVADVSAGKKRAVRKKQKLTEDQTRKLLAALPGDVRLLCCTALFGTLRVSEMLGLQEKHMDCETGTIHIEQRYWRGDLDVTKGDKSTRDVPMGGMAGELRMLLTGDPDRFVFQIKTRPQWGRVEALCRDDRAIHQHFLKPAAVLLKCYFKGFGF